MDNKIYQIESVESEDKEEDMGLDNPFCDAVSKYMEVFDELLDSYRIAVNKLAEYESKKCTCCGGIKED